MPDRYCVGPSMAVDWGDEQPPRLSWCLVQRIFGYFLPYWRRGLVALTSVPGSAPYNRRAEESL